MDSYAETTILIVDDSPTNSIFLLNLLQQAGFHSVIANSGESALKEIEAISPSLILLDVMLPEMDGFELCCRLKQVETTQDIPIIFMTSLDKTEDKVKGLSLGAVDYITKPLQKEDVLARVNVHLKLRNLNKKLEERTAELTLALNRLQTSQLQLIQSEKMSLLGQLVAGVAHEINNPVGSISANILYASTYVKEIIEHLRLYQQKSTDIQIAAHAKEIELEYLIEDLFNILVSMDRSAIRIKDISSSLRIFCRHDHEEMVSFDIHEGLDSTLLILKHRLDAIDKQPKIEVVKNYGNLPMVRCFPGPLNQVFMNLLVNAVDALRDSFRSDKINPQIIISTALNADYTNIIISIQDNGAGIPENILPHIFEYAFTTKPVGKGTGLGLAIAHQIIVEKHGGSLAVNSIPSEGAEFVIKLPI
ncbi:sensor histidine kinase [Iningainema tapete]|uniref:histidine kinase n=1 Tax=Iningainema tapete BLCC-T55 TaxID=2748662 RepID=A0A8J6XFS9_9CYAN|nr:response regulator [Iningainema tapete]MBD2775895.1 response regulator [Iningainema tapete BLCC-T55]